MRTRINKDNPFQLARFSNSTRLLGFDSLLFSVPFHTQADPLPSWNDGPAKKAILEFVAAVTDKNGKDYVKPSDRIATFDNDGTLWVEQPMYTQILFAFDRVKDARARNTRSGRTKQPFKAVLEGTKRVDGIGRARRRSWRSSRPLIPE